MDTLVSLGTLAAFGWSAVVLLGGLEAETYFETAAVITTLILLGRFLEARATRRSGDAIRSLLELGAREATLLRDGAEVVVPVDALVAGDVFVVRPGERIAADGVVVEGAAAVDASMLTGEPVPVEVVPGSNVTGGTIDTDGRLVVRATAVGADTTLARIARLVAEAQTGKAPVQRLVDRVSRVFVPAVLVLSAGTLVTWLALGQDTADSFTAAVAVVIIACPCALGLATPTALMVGTGRGAQLGVLIRGPEALEHARRRHHRRARQDGNRDHRSHERRAGRHGGSRRARGAATRGCRRGLERASDRSRDRRARRAPRSATSRRPRGSRRAPGSASRRPSTAAGSSSGARRS